MNEMPFKERNIFSETNFSIFTIFIFFSFLALIPFWHFTTDGGIFITGGYLMKEGKILYLDFFDHKPPLIFVVTYLGALLDSGQFGFRLLELLVIVITFYALWKEMTSAKVPLYPFLYAIMIGYFFFPYVYDKGFFTEVFGSLFLVLAFICGRNKKWLLSGILTGLAVWSKEPYFLFIFYPLFLKLTRRELTCYFIALCTVGLVGLLGLCFFENLAPYLRILQYDFQYSDLRPTNWEAILSTENWKELIKSLLYLLVKLFPIVLCGFVLLKNDHTNKGLLIYLMAIGLIGICLGKRFYSHYYLFLFPGLAYTAFSFPEAEKLCRKERAMIMGSAIFLLCFSFCLTSVHFIRDEVVLQKSKIQQDVANYLREHSTTGTTMIAGDTDSAIYALAKIKPAFLPHIVTFSHHFPEYKSSPRIVSHKLRQMLHDKKPDYLYNPRGLFWFEEDLLSSYTSTEIPKLFVRIN